MAELNIAIADDSRQTLKLLDEILEKEEGIHVVGKADNGEDAYNMIVRTNPDIVLMDVIMPKMDGISVMEKKKQHADEGKPVLYHDNGRQQPVCDRGRLPSRCKLLYHEAL